VLDQQSGISKSTKFIPTINKTNVTGDNRTSKGAGMFGEGYILSGASYNDTGGASRFFYCPKASKKDRNEGCDMLEEKGYEVNFKESPKQGSIEKYGMEEALQRLKGLTSKNNHPTVKPTDLMLYLIKLVTPVGGTVLDCFLGSGSTGKAAIRGGFDFIGIEREEEYIKIAEARIKNELNG
jgi:site-specific DNA-methyltransferase (adenine-specific)